MIKKILSQSEKETVENGKKILEGFPEAKLVNLYGGLGSGKTTLIKGIAQYHKVPFDLIKSPTYAYYNVYDGQKRIYHFDLYRLNENESEELELEIEEIMQNDDNLLIVEWADRMPSLAKYSHLKIQLFMQGESNRLIMVENLC